MEEKVNFQNARGEKLVGILSNPSGDLKKPVILLAHGHSSNKNTKNFVTLKNTLDKQHISSFRIDLYGHGESAGKFEEATVSDAVESILSAIQYLKSLGYTKIGLVGSSFGGLASLIAASRSADLFLLVLKSPVSSYVDLHTWRGTDINNWKQKGYREYSRDVTFEKLHYTFYEDAIINDGYRVASNISIPTLIVHGDEDEQVPYEQSVKLAQLISNSTLVTIKGADHTYTSDDHAKEMLKVISDFVFAHL